MSIIEILKKYPEKPRVIDGGFVRLVPGMQFVYPDKENTVVTVISTGIDSTIIDSDRYGKVTYALYEKSSAIR